MNESTTTAPATQELQEIPIGTEVWAVRYGMIARGTVISMIDHEMRERMGLPARAQIYTVQIGDSEYLEVGRLAIYTDPEEAAQRCDDEASYWRVSGEYIRRGFAPFGRGTL